VCKADNEDFAKWSKTLTRSTSTCLDKYLNSSPVVSGAGPSSAAAVASSPMRRAHDDLCAALCTTTAGPTKALQDAIKHTSSTMKDCIIKRANDNIATIVFSFHVRRWKCTVGWTCPTKQKSLYWCGQTVLIYLRLVHMHYDEAASQIMDPMCFYVHIYTIVYEERSTYNSGCCALLLICVTACITPAVHASNFY
jgi:hypothetical protein